MANEMVHTIEGERTMTVGDLIAKLQQFDPTQGIEISVTQYNKIYPIGYLPVEDVIPGPFSNVRMQTSLPDNMRTMKLKR